MGQESSTPIDEYSPSKTLENRTLDGLAKYIQDGNVKKVVVMTGAGISTSAGIPDFRSPKTGLYANLARLNLPYAEAVFDISYFRTNPLPFYTLAHELYPGRYRPTVTHSFVRLLHEKGLLLKCFSQNIDCLEREAGVPDDKMIEAHGSFAKQSCIECKAPYPKEEIMKHVEEKKIPKCHECNGLVKPEIVFFGEQLPAAFHDNIDLPAEADLVIVMGTSLTVQPFASLPSAAKDGTPRLLINMERVGGLGSRSDDVLLLGDCDSGVRKLCKAVGWDEELEEIWAKTDPDYVDAKSKKSSAKLVREEKRQSLTKDEKLHNEVEKLTQEIDQTLSFSKSHESRVRAEHLQDKVERDVEGLDQHGNKIPNTMSYGDDSTLNHVFPHLGSDGKGDKKSNL